VVGFDSIVANSISIERGVKVNFYKLLSFGEGPTGLQKVTSPENRNPGKITY
jgi:hypothetical protein